MGARWRPASSFAAGLEPIKLRRFRGKALRVYRFRGSRGATRRNNLDFGSERERPVAEIQSAPSELAACRDDAAPQRARLCPYTAVTSSMVLTTLSWPRWSPARTTEWRNSARIHCWAVPIRAEVVAILPWKCGWARAASIEHQPLHCTDPPFTSNRNREHLESWHLTSSKRGKRWRWRRADMTPGSAEASKSFGFCRLTAGTISIASDPSWTGMSVWSWRARSVRASISGP